MKTAIYFKGKLIHTIIHPKSVTDKKEAIQETRDKILVCVVEE